MAISAVDPGTAVPAGAPAPAAAPAIDPGNQQFIDERQKLLDAAETEALRAHFQAEIDLVKSWSSPPGQTPGTEAPGSEGPGSGAPGVETPGSPTTPPQVEPEIGTPGIDNPGRNRTPGSDGEFNGALPPVLEPYRDTIMQAASEAGMPPELLAAQIMQESGGDPSATSVNPQLGTTDSGLLQVSIPIFEGLKQKYPEKFGGRSHDELTTDPELAIFAGAYHMKDNYEQFGSWKAALRVYVSGSNGFDPSNPENGSYSPGTDQNYLTNVQRNLSAITPEPVMAG